MERRADQDQSPAPQIEWISTGTDAVDRQKRTRPFDGRHRTVAAAVAIMVLIVVVSMLRSQTARPEAAQPAVQPGAAIGAVAPSDTVEPVAAGLNMSDLARTMLAPVTIVATDLVTGEALILRSADGGSVDAEQLRGLQSFALDSSGEWLAAMGDGSPGFDLGSLWIGPLGGDLERLATGVGTFAWHDSSPQEMAVLSDPVTGQAQIVTFRVPNPHAESVRLRPTRSRVGALEAWGKWGYAVRLSPGAPTFDIVTPSFAMLAANQPGRLVGTVQGSRIMYSPNGDTGRPLMINSDSGIVYPIGALLEPQRVWNIAEGGLDGLVAVQTSNHATGLDSTLVVDGTVILAELDASAGVRPMQWDPSGTQLYTMSQEPDVGTQIEVFDTRTQVTTVYSLADISPETHIVRILAVGDRPNPDT